MYRFYGWQDVGPEVLRLYDALREIWAADTCAPRMRAEWTPDNPTLGQCSITAFLVQDLLGGEVCGVPLGYGNYHCYNIVGGVSFDLTSEQFGDTVLNYVDNPPQLRRVHFAQAEKQARYELLKSRLFSENPALF